MIGQSKKREATLEIVVLWGETVLRVAHLTPPRPFSVGEDAGCDVTLPADALGARRVSIVEVDPSGVVALVVPRGADADMRPSAARAETPRDPEDERRLTLSLGSRARLSVGSFTFLFSLGEAEVGVRRFHRHSRTLRFHLASALGHAAIVALFATWAASKPLGESEVSNDQIEAMQRALRVGAELEQEEETATVDSSLADSGGYATGRRAKGEDGTMGAADTKRTSARYGTQRPSDAASPSIAREAAMRDAGEFGMIGLLNSGAGGDPNAPTAPWGRDDALGNDPLSARGNAWGSSIGDLRGAGGLGLSGIGGVGGKPGASPAAASGGPTGGIPTPTGALGGPIGSATNTEAARRSIDPNGRFATTYRPGGGHLASFEAAVARGIVPAAARQLVGDVGAFYAPENVALDAGKALAMRADFERTALPPSGGSFHLRVALRSSADTHATRPHLSVHLVLDVSGSMAGESIARARDAAQALVDRLAPTDDFSLVTFSTDADLLVPDGPVGSRRDAIRKVIAGVKETGGTNIGAGLDLGYAQASLKTIPEDAVRVVLLVSDGRANEGVTSGEQLSLRALNAFQSGIQTSAFGLGADYDGALMSSIATDGAGGYYYLRHPDQIAPALVTELDRRLDPVATAVELRIRLKRGVELLRVYGSRRLETGEAARVRAIEVAADRQAEKRDGIRVNRQDDTEGGMRFFIPAFAPDDRHAVLIELNAGAGVGHADVGTIEIKYKDRLAQKNVVEELPIRVDYANSDAESAKSASASVARTVQGFAAGEALLDASARIARGDRAGAASLLSEREGILRQAATSLGEPSFVREADRLARLRSHAGTDAGLGEPLVLAMLLESAGRSCLH